MGKDTDHHTTETGDDRLLTPRDIQRIFSFGKNRAYELMNSSGFPTIRIGSRMYVTRAALEKWLDMYKGCSYLV